MLKGGELDGLRIHKEAILSRWPEKASEESCVLHGYHGSWREDEKLRTQ